ncbi:MAG: hypothetical protein LBC59_09475 [Chitinispirillales bacterium]|nr:hypothetical protein [Chitinispirillales bacterium]
MPNRPLSPCRKQGCSNLVPQGGTGYCPTHAHVAKADVREGFSALDRKKTPEQKAFYSSTRWTETSLKHRQLEPLCRRCKAKGRVVAAEMVHHNPPVDVLLREGKSPFDHQYLESLCNDCHLGELRLKRRY